MTNLKLGALLWTQGATMQEQLAGAREVERLGYDSLWTWDHLHAIFGDPMQDPSSRAGRCCPHGRWPRPGCSSGCSSVPTRSGTRVLAAKLAATLDHVSEGRAVLGIGGAWFEYEHTAHGIDFGTGFGQRLDWLDEAVAACRRAARRGHGDVTERGHYAFHELRQEPLPLQTDCPS